MTQIAAAETVICELSGVFSWVLGFDCLELLDLIAHLLPRNSFLIDVLFDREDGDEDGNKDSPAWDLGTVRLGSGPVNLPPSEPVRNGSTSAPSNDINVSTCVLLSVPDLPSLACVHYLSHPSVASCV
jgi:hypothetical protein